MNGRVRKTTRRFVICEPWEVVVVPFPFTDTAGTKRRPALVLSETDFNRSGATVLAMITTSTHVPWSGDVEIRDLGAAGLKASCTVRFKIFTLDNRLILRRIGCLSDADLGRVAAEMRWCFGASLLPKETE